MTLEFLYYSSLVLWLIGVYFLRDLKIRLIAQKKSMDLLDYKLFLIEKQLQKEKYIIEVYQDYAKFNELIIDKNELVTN